MDQTNILIAIIVIIIIIAIIKKTTLFSSIFQINNADNLQKLAKNSMQDLRSEIAKLKVIDVKPAQILRLVDSLQRLLNFIIEDQEPDEQTKNSNDIEIGLQKISEMMKSINPPKQILDKFLVAIQNIKNLAPFWNINKK